MRTLAIVLGLAFAAVAIVSGSCLPARCRAFFRGSKPARRACISSMASPRRSSPSCFSPSRGTPGDPARDGTAGALSERHSAFHGMMTRSSSLRASVIRKPMIAITNKPTYICSTANVLQALQIR